MKKEIVVTRQNFARVAKKILPKAADRVCQRLGEGDKQVVVRVVSGKDVK